MFGLEKKNSERLWIEYEHFLKNKLVLLPLDRKVIEVYSKEKSRLLSKGTAVGEFDLLIGATALANGLRLATLNTRDFLKIDLLEVEDWGR